MNENETAGRQPERAVLAAVDTGEYDAERSLDELAELAATAGAQVEGRLIQRRESPDKATCLGGGRLEELRLICENTGIDLVIFDCELSATQLRNLEDVLPCRVVDRTTLILDIFAARARSAEGRLQVELAQLQYRLPRLAGQGAALSRLGGGIGTRGPGESQLETDRRHIRRRINALRQQLADVERRRQHLRQRRKKDGMTTVAIVGYTNAGKSTLLNTLTSAGVLAEDKLFATLDPTARALRAAGRAAGDPHRYGRLCPPPAASSRGGIPFDARGGGTGGPAAQPVRRLKPGCAGPPRGHLRAARRTRLHRPADPVGAQ